MSNDQNRKNLSLILRDLAEEIDVPASKYREAKAHYEAVGTWLGDDDSELAPYRPTIYPQGSFALGTVVRPLGDDEYDVDAVCLLALNAGQVSQQQLKALVGARLKDPRSRYKEMLDPKEGGRRCWTIKYADASKFHLDVLPAIPDEYEWLLALGVPPGLAESAICITDSTTWNTDAAWPKSNSKGYVGWFKDRMRVRLDEAKRALAVQKAADVEEIEDFDVRTPLQGLIQILKRHRDVRYNGNDDKPISIIITTLAALAYDNEEDLADAILNVVPRMRASVENRGGVWWVPNPVNPNENFADRWAESPRKAALFFEWLDAVEQESAQLLTDSGIAKAGAYLGKAFGQRDADAVMAKYTERESSRISAAAAVPIVLTPRKSERPATPRIELPASPSKPWKP